MIPTSDLWRELHTPPALAPRIKDAGFVLADLALDQPPFVGVMLELAYPELGHKHRQMFKLDVRDLDFWITQLTAMQEQYIAST